jgi:hypothetical protein
MGLFFLLANGFNSAGEVLGEPDHVEEDAGDDHAGEPDAPDGDRAAATDGGER